MIFILLIELLDVWFVFYGLPLLLEIPSFSPLAIDKACTTWRELSYPRMYSRIFEGPPPGRSFWHYFFDGYLPGYPFYDNCLATKKLLVEYYTDPERPWRKDGTLAMLGCEVPFKYAREWKVKVDEAGWFCEGEKKDGCGIPSEKQVKEDQERRAKEKKAEKEGKKIDDKAAELDWIRIMHGIADHSYAKNRAEEAKAAEQAAKEAEAKAEGKTEGKGEGQDEKNKPERKTEGKGEGKEKAGEGEAVVGAPVGPLDQAGFVPQLGGGEQQGGGQEQQVGQQPQIGQPIGQPPLGYNGEQQGLAPQQPPFGQQQDMGQEQIQGGEVQQPQGGQVQQIQGGGQLQQQLQQAATTYSSPVETLMPSEQPTTGQQPPVQQPTTGQQQPVLQQGQIASPGVPIVPPTPQSAVVPQLGVQPGAPQLAVVPQSSPVQHGAAPGAPVASVLASPTSGGQQQLTSGGQQQLATPSRSPSSTLALDDQSTSTSQTSSSSSSSSSSPQTDFLDGLVGGEKNEEQKDEEHQVIHDDMEGTTAGALSDLFDRWLGPIRAKVGENSPPSSTIDMNIDPVGGVYGEVLDDGDKRGYLDTGDKMETGGINDGINVDNGKELSHGNKEMNANGKMHDGMNVEKEEQWEEGENKDNESITKVENSGRKLNGRLLRVEGPKSSSGTFR